MTNLDIPQLSDWASLTGFGVLLFVIIFLRYVIVCLAFDLFFNHWARNRFDGKRINTRLKVKPGQRRHEILWSFITSFIFTLFFIILLYAYNNGWTRLYTGFSAIDIIYIPCSIFIYLFLQDTYYYWLHRWMHKPNIYHLVHKVHHHSVVSSPWTSFSFHPIESILQAITLPILLLVVPLHVVGLLFLLVVMTVTAVINHLDIEIYPEGFEKHWFGKWMIGATHHSLHHSKFVTNFGLYFTFWDSWMNTESAEYASMVNARHEIH